MQIPDIAELVACLIEGKGPVASDVEADLLKAFSKPHG
jgi:hypothetical protein